MILLACVWSISSGQAPSPDAGAPDPHKAEIGACQKLVVGVQEPGKASALAGSLLAKPDLTPYARMFLLDCLSWSKMAMGDFSSAVASEEKVLQILKAHPMPVPVRTNLLSNAGGLFASTGDFTRAEPLLQEALSLAAKNNLPDAQVSALMNIASIYSNEFCDAVSADRYFRSALDLQNSTGHDNPALRLAYGANLVELKRYSEALHVLTPMAKAVGFPQRGAGIQYRANTERAKVFLARQNLTRAQKILERSASGQRSLPDPGGVADTLITLGKVHLQKGEDAAALTSATEAETWAEQARMTNLQVAALHLQEHAYASLGQPSDALAAAQRANRMEVDMLKSKNTRVLAGYESRLKNLEIENQNEKLQTLAEIQTIKIKRGNFMRNMLLGLLALVVTFAITFVCYQRRVSRRLRALSTTDPLSGLLNRREASRLLREQDASMSRTGGKHTALFLMDVDHFKLVNDTYGHDAGDRTLVELTNRIRAVCRPDDLVARWGGEEFLIAVWRVTPREAADLAERLLTVVKSHPITLQDKVSITVTATVGFVLYPHAGSPLIKSWRQAAYLADRILYAAKHSGRDAWAGLWATETVARVPVQTIYDDPAQAIRNGWIEVIANVPLIWPDPAAAFKLETPSTAPSPGNDSSAAQVPAPPPAG